MDEETIIGIQKMRHKAATDTKEYNTKVKVYEKALEDILNAHTVGKMIEIADRVLSENKK